MVASDYRVRVAPDEGWGLEYQGKRLALFPAKAQAIRAAVSMAKATATPSVPVRVFAEALDGTSYVIWNSSKDDLIMRDEA